MSRKNKEYKEKRNLLSIISEKLLNETEEAEQPYFVQRKLKGYSTAAVGFAGVGIIGAIFTKSLPLFALGILLAAVIGILGYLQRKSFAERGCEIWHFEVLEYTKITSLLRRPTGMYAEALDGPYEGHTCHLAISGQGALPPEGRIIQVCVPGNTEANLIRDVYYIPTYYGMELVREEN